MKSKIFFDGRMIELYFWG